MKLTHLYLLCMLLPVLHMQSADHLKQTAGIRFGIYSNVSAATPSSRATSQLISEKNDHLHKQVQLQEEQLKLEEQQRKLQKEQQVLEQLIEQGIRHEHTFSYPEKGNIIVPLGALLNLNNQKKRHLTQQAELCQQLSDLTGEIKQAENQIPADVQMYLINNEDASNILEQWIKLLNLQKELLIQNTNNAVNIDLCQQQIPEDISDRLLTDTSAMKATTMWLNLRQKRATLDAPLSKIDDNLDSINSAIVNNKELLRTAFNYFVTNDIETLTQFIINEKRNELSKNPQMNCENITFNDQEIRAAIFKFKIKQLGNNLKQDEYDLLHSIIPTIPLNTCNPAESKQETYHLNTPEALIDFSQSLLKNKALYAKRVAALNTNPACNIFEISLTDQEKQAATSTTKIGEQLQKITSAEQFAAVIKQYPQYNHAPALIEDPAVDIGTDTSDERQHIHTIQTILQATVQQYCNILPSHLKSSQDAVKVSRGLLHMMELIQKRIKFLHNSSGCHLDIIEDIILTEQEKETAASGWRCHQIIQNITEDDFSNTLSNKPLSNKYVRQESVKPTQKQDETQISIFDLGTITNSQERIADKKQNEALTSQPEQRWFNSWL